MADHNIHQFVPAVIPLFENCEFCGEKILSIFNSAYQCSKCLKYCHKQCCETADSICPCRGVPDSEDNQEQIFKSFPVNRAVTDSTYEFYDKFMKPTFLRKEDPNQQSAISSQLETYHSNHNYQDALSDSSESNISSSSKYGALYTPQAANSPMQFNITDNTVMSTVSIGERPHSVTLRSSKLDVLSQPGFLTVIVQQATDLQLPTTKQTKIYAKVTLLPWGNERFRTATTDLNEGFPDWDECNNTFSFVYPGALPKVNPLIRISIKMERSIFAIKKVSLGVIQVPLRKVIIEPNKYNDNWYSVYRDGNITAGKVRISFMFCPDVTQIKTNEIINPQRTHYFEKQILEPSALTSDCPVCRKSLISGIVDNTYKCKVCGMIVHGNCRERAKSIFKCIPLKKKSSDTNEALSEKLLRSIKKKGILTYDQPIGYLSVYINQITLFHLKNKHKSLYLQLSCDQIEQSSVSFNYAPIIDVVSDDFHFTWFIFDPAATLRITVKDRISLQTIGYMQISIQQIEYEQSEIELTETPMYAPLSIHRIQQSLPIKTYDLLHKTSTSMSTIGSLSCAIHYQEEPCNLFSKQQPSLPPIPEMTPAVASAFWIRLWQLAKIFIDLYDVIKFSISWEFPPLSLAVCICYFFGVLFFSFEYIHLYILMVLILLFVTTFILRKKHLIAKTIQTNKNSSHSYYQISSSLIDLVNTPVNQMKNTLSATTLLLFGTNLGFSIMEKMYHLFLWTQPAKTRYALLMCIIGALVSMILPLRVILLGIGCCILFPKKIDLLPYIYSFINFLNSFPDDDQVYNLLCPNAEYTTTADGTVHKINYGYCKTFMDVLIADSDTRIWKKGYIGIGYDGIVRKWKCEEEVEKKKGLSLFYINTIASTRAISVRELAGYGIESDCDWSAGVTNSIILSVTGKVNQLALSFKNAEECSQFLENITD